jgi:hypothetical protein
MTFCDQVGGITGITTAGSILSNTLTTKLNSLALPNVSAELVRQSSDYVWALDPSTRVVVLEAYMNAISMSFWSSFGFAAVGLIATLGLKSYVMRKDLK